MSTMELQSKQPTAKGPAETFTGDVWFDVITRGDDYARMRVNVVRFAPGARTAWHAHPAARPCTSLRGAAWCSLAAARLSRCGLATSSTPRPVSGTGMAPRPATS